MFLSLKRELGHFGATTAAVFLFLFYQVHLGLSPVVDKIGIY